MTKSHRFANAVHILALLARGDGRPTSSRSLARGVRTNPVVIRRLLPALARAGRVIPRQGAGGGTRLARPAGDIDLLSVYEAVEPDGSLTLRARPLETTCRIGPDIQ